MSNINAEILKNTIIDVSKEHGLTAQEAMLATMEVGICFLEAAYGNQGARNALVNFADQLKD